MNRTYSKLRGLLSGWRLAKKASRSVITLPTRDHVAWISKTFVSIIAIKILLTAVVGEVSEIVSCIIHLLLLIQASPWRIFKEWSVQAVYHLASGFKKLEIKHLTKSAGEDPWYILLGKWLSSITNSEVRRYITAFGSWCLRCSCLRYTR